MTDCKAALSGERSGAMYAVPAVSVPPGKTSLLWRIISSVCSRSAVHQQHQLRIQIWAAHIPVERTDDAEAIVDQDGLCVHGVFSAPFADPYAGFQNGLFLIEIVGAAPRICAALRRVRELFSKCKNRLR